MPKVLASKSPRPQPWGLRSQFSPRSLLLKAVKTLSTSSWGMPIPVSTTDISTTPRPDFLARRIICPPLFVNFMELLRRLRITCLALFGSELIYSGTKALMSRMGQSPFMRAWMVTTFRHSARCERILNFQKKNFILWSCIYTESSMSLIWLRSNSLENFAGLIYSSRSL